MLVLSLFEFDKCGFSLEPRHITRNCQCGTLLIDIVLRKSLRMSGWPSGLRRCVQVAVSPGGVGSNPTSDIFLIITFALHHMSTRLESN